MPSSRRCTTTTLWCAAASLLERLRNPAEAAAWNRFVPLYTPFIYHWAPGAGRQPADAADLVQEVRTSLVQSLPRFEYDSQKSLLLETNPMNRFVLTSLVWLALLPTLRAAGEQFIFYDKNGWWTSDVNHPASKKITELVAANHELKCLAFTPTGGWVVLFDRNGYYGQGLPDEVFKKMKEIAGNNGELKWIAFTPTGGWSLFWDQNGNWSRGTSDAAFKEIVEIAKNGGTLKSIAFSPSGNTVIFSDKNGYWNDGGIGDEAFKKFGEIGRAGGTLNCIAFTSFGGWTLLWDQNGNWSRGISEDYFQKVAELAKNGRTLRCVAFAPDDLTRGRYRLEVTPAQRVKAVLTTDFTHPDARVANWYLYAAETPTLTGQTAVKSTFSPETKIVKENSPLQRPMFFANLTDGRKQVHAVLTIEATLMARRLRALNSGEKPPEVKDLTPDEVRKYTRSSQLLDLSAGPLQDWMAKGGLKRKTGESDLAFAYRTFAYMKKHCTYMADPPNWAVAATCQAGKSDCGGLSSLVTAVLRANGIPARDLPGRWAMSQKAGDDYHQWHVKGEFFAHGIGWVPFDAASAVGATDGSALAFFGNDPGDFVTMHVDQDLLIDSFVAGKQNFFVSQGICAWCSPNKALASKENWTVQKEAMPK